MIPVDLSQAVRAFVARPRVLVGLDFDGVLSPIVEDRDAARPVAGAMDEVRELAGLDGVEVTLVSGRALESLRRVTGLADDDPVGAVGSHGAELSPQRHPAGGSEAPAAMTSGGSTALTALTVEQATLLARVVDALQDIAAAAGPGSGLDVELKPSAAVLHTRRAAVALAESAEVAATTGPGSWRGVHAIRGKAVVELTVVETSKGAALQRLRADLGVEAVLYAGDDVTDETAFMSLGPDDVAVKVGPGATHASYRLDGPDDVLELLQLLVAERSQR